MAPIRKGLTCLTSAASMTVHSIRASLNNSAAVKGLGALNARLATGFSSTLPHARAKLVVTMSATCNIVSNARNVACHMIAP